MKLAQPRQDRSERLAVGQRVLVGGQPRVKLSIQISQEQVHRAPIRRKVERDELPVGFINDRRGRWPRQRTEQGVERRRLGCNSARATLLGHSVARRGGPAHVLGASLNLRRVVLKGVGPQAGRETRAGSLQHADHMPREQGGMPIARSRSDVTSGGGERCSPHDGAPHGIDARRRREDGPQAAGHVRQGCERDVGRRVAKSPDRRVLQEVDGLRFCRWRWSQGHDSLRVPQIAPLQIELGHRDLAGVQSLDAHRTERILIHVHRAENAEVGQGTEDAAPRRGQDGQP